MYLGVVSDVATCRLSNGAEQQVSNVATTSSHDHQAQDSYPVMDYTGSSRRHCAKGVDVRHDIVAAFLLLDAGQLEVVIGDPKVSSHLLEGFRRDGLDPQLLLALGQVEPQLAPSRVARSLAEELRHLTTAVSPRQGRLVRVESRCAGHLE